MSQRNAIFINYWFFLQIFTIFAFYSIYKIKGLRASKCIKFKMLTAICQRFNYKVNVLGTMCNWIHKNNQVFTFFFLWCLKDKIDDKVVIVE